MLFTTPFGRMLSGWWNPKMLTPLLVARYSFPSGESQCQVFAYSEPDSPCSNP